MIKSTPFLKKILFQKTKFFMELCPNIQNFVCILLARNFQNGCAHCTGVATKSRFPINSCYKFFFLSRYFCIKKWQLSIFFLMRGKRHVWMTNVKVITKFWEVFSRFKNVINISFVKNWFKLFWVLYKPFDFIKWYTKVFAMARPKGLSYGHAILLLSLNIKFDSYASSDRRFLFIPSIHCTKNEVFR